jgi:hypothetical protein
MTVPQLTVPTVGTPPPASQACAAAIAECDPTNHVPPFITYSCDAGGLASLRTAQNGRSNDSMVMPHDNVIGRCDRACDGRFHAHGGAREPPAADRDGLASELGGDGPPGLSCSTLFTATASSGSTFFCPCSREPPSARCARRLPVSATSMLFARMHDGDQLGGQLDSNASGRGQRNPGMSANAGRGCGGG